MEVASSEFGSGRSMDQKRRLLAIDDDEQIAEILSIAGTRFGFDAKVVTEPEAFKDIFKTFDPDVIIVDVVMPEMDGIELLRHLAESGCNVPVLVISGFNPHYMHSMEQLGADWGLPSVSSMKKPFRMDDLKSYLDQVPYRAHN